MTQNNTPSEQSQGQPLEGEVVFPSRGDEWVKRHWEAADPVALKSFFADQVRDVPDLDPGRAAFAAIGGGIGSIYRWVGAAAGASMGAMLWDALKTTAQKRNERRFRR